MFLSLFKQAVFLLCCTSTSLFAQQSDQIAKPQTHDEFAERVISSIERYGAVNTEEKEWLKKLFAGGCECSLLEGKEEKENCSTELFSSLDLPVTEEGLSNMNTEQQRKFNLLSPLANMLGSCPEHR